MTILDVCQATGGTVCIYRDRARLWGTWMAAYEAGDIQQTGRGTSPHAAVADLVDKLAHHQTARADDPSVVAARAALEKLAEDKP